MITIYKPGLLTTIQDLGRFGYQKYGVVVGGAMDTIAHRIANLLVGNQEQSATLEITLIGPTIQFHEDTLLSICGADLSPSINGQRLGLWRPIFVRKGSELKFGQCKSGCRAYVAVAGGFSVSTIMGSKATYLRAALGGMDGRALQAGDQLLVDKPTSFSKKIMSVFSKRTTHSESSEGSWFVSPQPFYQAETNFAIRTIRGREYPLFSEECQRLLFQSPFRITTNSDRMGYRLKGPSLSLQCTREMISEAVGFGTIQVPKDGNPIILLADRQTTGGYPKIGQVASVDLPLLAQMKPGEEIYFSEISLAEAQYLYLEREYKIQEMRKGIEQKFE